MQVKTQNSRVLQPLFQRILEPANIVINGSNPWDMQIHDERFYRRLLLSQSVGLGESYMDGWWTCEHIDELFFRLQRHLNRDGVVLNTLFNLHFAVHYFFSSHLLINNQSKSRSQAVTEQHYNLNNPFYEAMLGPTMAYTCGYWKNVTDLDTAQRQKYDLVCQKLMLQPGERVLELGCGWGGFARYAAENYGVTVDAVNLGSKQIELAKMLCKDLPVNLYACDYRDADLYNPKRIQYDKVVSIGLCEHVGHKNYGHFLRLVRRQLKEDGLFLLHTIGKNISRHATDRWIQKYIFPGGMLPSLSLLSRAAENLFVIEDLHNFGADYDKTLMAWHANFEHAWPHFSDQFDERFYRMWRYYLLICAGSFRARSMQLWQLILSPKGQLSGYKRLS